jgi:hypothetical protein
MNIDELNHILVLIADKRMELNRLTYSDIHYDDLEEELHHLEDDLVAHFGKELENILHQIHRQYCPETEVLSPIAYLAQNYIKTGLQTNGTAIYDLADNEQGLEIDSKDYPSAHLVIVPNPVKILLLANGEIRRAVWEG